jgi:hypothetical protein
MRRIEARRTLNETARVLLNGLYSAVGQELPESLKPRMGSRQVGDLVDSGLGVDQIAVDPGEVRCRRFLEQGPFLEPAAIGRAVIERGKQVLHAAQVTSRHAVPELPNPPLHRSLFLRRQRDYGAFHCNGTRHEPPTPLFAENVPRSQKVCTGDRMDFGECSWRLPQRFGVRRLTDK